MNETLHQTLQRPCLIERTEGVIIVEPLRFYRVYRGHYDRADRVCRHPA